MALWHTVFVFSPNVCATSGSGTSSIRQDLICGRAATVFVSVCVSLHSRHLESSESSESYLAVACLPSSNSGLSSPESYNLASSEVRSVRPMFVPLVAMEQLPFVKISARSATMFVCVCVSVLVSTAGIFRCSTAIKMVFCPLSTRMALCQISVVVVILQQCFSCGI